MFDEAALEASITKLDKYLRNLEAIKFPTIPEIKPVPHVKIYSVPAINLPTVKYPTLYDVHCDIPDISAVAHDIKELLQKRCPLCGKEFIDASESIMC